MVILFSATHYQDEVNFSRYSNSHENYCSSHRNTTMATAAATMPVTTIFTARHHSCKVSLRHIMLKTKTLNMITTSLLPLVKLYLIVWLVTQTLVVMTSSINVILDHQSPQTGSLMG